MSGRDNNLKGLLIKLGVLLGPLLLVGSVFAACSSPPTSGSTPTLLPALIETPTSVSPATPTSTALPKQDAHTGATTSFASIETSPESASSPLLISFRAVDLAHAMFGPVTGYRWDFGDGEAGSGPKAEHTYKLEGDYAVLLTILYEDGTRSVVEKTIKVPPASITSGGVSEATATPSPGPTAASATTSAATGATPAATLTPASDATPSMVQLEELEISSKGAVLRVSLQGLPETVADLVQSLDDVTKVEKYLRVLAPSYPDPFIGVEPGSEFRVEDSIVSLVVGEGFQSGEERVAIPGFGVNSNSYSGGAMAHAAMAHRFMAGQSFEVDGTRLRVVGLFRAPDESQENAILLPLATAQEIFAMRGELTDIFVTVNSEDNAPAIEAAIRNLLGAK